MRQTATFLVTLMVLAAADAPAQQPSTAARTYVIDRESSQITVLVFRSGLLAAAGHNHTVTSRDLDGSILIDSKLEDSKVTLRFPVELLQLDNPEDRALAGEQFEKPLSDRDIAATRRNMLGERLLHASRFAEVLIESTRVSGDLPSLEIHADVTVRGETRPISFPASVYLDDGVLIASGSRRLSHAELGLRPFSAGFGTLRVADQMLVSFSIVGVPPGD